MDRSKRMYMVVMVFVVVSVQLMFLSGQAYADKKITAAVVAGFIMPFGEIAAAYKAKTSVKIVPTYTSAGRFYGQIVNGAPYDIFLSADRERPDLLHEKALCEKPFVYAKGELVLWSSNRSFCDSPDWRSALARDGVKKIAIANPETAVHGGRAKRALEDAGLWNAVTPRLVYAPDLSQVFQFASEGAVDVAFCSLAHAYTDKGKTGCYYEMKGVPAVVYSACVLKNAKEIDRTRDFAAFLVSTEAETIKKKYGYTRITDDR